MRPTLRPPRCSTETRRRPRSCTDPFGIDLIVEPEAAGKLAATFPVAGMWAFEAARIAARVPRPGLDTDHKTLPHEVGLIESAVHLNKGCYRGQETVARIHNLGHPPRRLVFLHLDGSVDRLPAHGSPLTLADGTQVGFIGSAARHFELGPIGLGLVKRSVDAGATLLADGVAAAQEVIVPPDAGAQRARSRCGGTACRSRRPAADAVTPGYLTLECCATAEREDLVLRKALLAAAASERIRGRRDGYAGHPRASSAGTWPGSPSRTRWRWRGRCARPGCS